MVRNTNYINKNDYKEVDPYTFQDELKLVRVGWQNSGAYFEFEGSEGDKYYMSQPEFEYYLQTNDIKLYGHFEFLKQGTIQSIGLVRQ